jgi:hypothetical protein
MRDLSHQMADNDAGDFRARHTDEPHWYHDRVRDVSRHRQQLLWGDDGHQTGEPFPDHRSLRILSPVDDIVCRNFF